MILYMWLHSLTSSHSAKKSWNGTWGQGYSEGGSRDLSSDLHVRCFPHTDFATQMAMQLATCIEIPIVSWSVLGRSTGTTIKVTKKSILKK